MTLGYIVDLSFAKQWLALIFMKNLVPILACYLSVIFFSCQEPIRKSSVGNTDIKYIDSVRLKTNAVDIAFFSDYGKSSL